VVEHDFVPDGADEANEKTTKEGTSSSRWESGSTPTAASEDKEGEGPRKSSSSSFLCACVRAVGTFR